MCERPISIIDVPLESEIEWNRRSIESPRERVQPLRQRHRFVFAPWVDRDYFSYLAVVVIESGIKFVYFNQRAGGFELNALICQNRSDAVQDCRRVQNRRRDMKLPATGKLVWASRAMIPPDRILMREGKINGTEVLPALFENALSGINREGSPNRVFHHDRNC